MSKLARGVKKAFNAAGLEVSRRSVAVDTETEPEGPRFRRGPAGPEVVDDAEYAALTDTYRRHPQTALSGHIWAEGSDPGIAIRDIDSTTFRADNAFVWQGRLHAPGDLALAALWTEHQDSAGLLDTLRETGEFGVDLLEVGGREWSRDLIDSVLEISFLLEHLPPGYLEAEPVVDIGAGYGRLVTRLAQATGNRQLVACDAIALSTLICRAYVEHLGLQDRVRVVPLHEVDALGGFGLATNVHSFSEMSPAAIAWWLDWLVERRVRYLFVVPNRSADGEPALNDDDGPSMVPLLEARGYGLLAHRRKYADPVVDSVAAYTADYYLYELRG